MEKYRAIIKNVTVLQFSITLQCVVALFVALRQTLQAPIPSTAFHIFEPAFRKFL